MTIRPSRALRALEAMFEEADRAPVPDHMYQLRVRRAARDYLSGETLRRQIKQLSDKSLASKLECSTKAIRQLVAGRPVAGMTEDDRALVVACRKERAQMERRAIDLSQAYLCHHYGVSLSDLRDEVARQQEGS